MKCIVDSSGAVSDVVVRESPSQILSDLAVPAIRQWRYTPAFCKDRDVPVSVYLYVSVTFGL
jgi:outer membrane biosynthesis protein TonB